jgi:LPS-assembly protein
MGRRRVLPWIFIAMMLIAGPAAAAEIELFQGQPHQGEPWRIRAEKITFDGARHTYLAEGRVEVRQGERRLTADWAKVNETTKMAWLRGNVIFVMEEDVFAGQEGEFNLATRCGEMKGARLFLKRNHFQVQSPLIRKTGDNSYYAESSTVTTCDADRPVWSFAAKKLEVVLEGYATSNDTMFKLLGVPVFYFPYAVLPVKSERQTGFLMPQYGQHRAGGTVVEVPFYWAISNHSDLTLYQTYLSNRGYMQGGQFRWRGHEDAAFTLQGFGMSDGYYAAPKPQRYWVAGMANMPLGNDWEFRGTLDHVSDRSYLKDFNFGYMGLNRYSRELLGDFGRNLEQEEVGQRVSNVLLSRNLAWANLTGYSRIYQRLNPLDQRPFQRLPGLSLNTLILPLGNTPFKVGLDTSYTHFQQDRGLTGHRLDFHPQLLCLAQPLPGLNFNSRVGFRETFFIVDHATPFSPQDDNQSRQLFDSKVSLSSSWVKDYGRDSESPSFYRHLLRPELTYWNIPKFDPVRLPHFDPFDIGWVVRANRNLPVREGDDPIGGVNALTFGISNHLLRRGKNLQGQVLVEDKLWFRVSQSAFFNKTSMGLDGSPQPHHRFSDVLGEMEFYPWKRTVMGLDMGVSPYAEGFNRANVKLTFLDNKRQQFFNVGYLYIKDFASQINVSTYINLLPSVKTYLTYSNTFQTNSKLERQYGLVIQRQCWGMSLSYTERPDDKRVGVSFYLPGVGERFRKGPVHFSEKKDRPD